jgi:hypothetical protein
MFVAAVVVVALPCITVLEFQKISLEEVELDPCCKII